MSNFWFNFTLFLIAALGGSAISYLTFWSLASAEMDREEMLHRQHLRAQEEMIDSLGRERSRVERLAERNMDQLRKMNDLYVTVRREAEVLDQEVSELKLQVNLERAISDRWKARVLNAEQDLVRLSRRFGQP